MTRPWFIELAPDTSNLGEVRSNFRAWLEMSDIILRSAREDMALVLNELIQNGIEETNASPDHLGEKLNVCAEAEWVNRTLTISVTDFGTGFRHTEPATFSPTSDRGRGLPIVRALVDSWSIARVDDERTVVTVRKDFSTRKSEL